MGAKINMENKLDALDRRLKLVEDALEELVQTRVHHVDLTEDLNGERNLRAEGVEVKPDEDFTPTVSKSKRTKKVGKEEKVKVVESLL